jgi:hypothetical protein
VARGGIRRLMMLLVLALLPAVPAAADWLIIPFAGTAFGGETSLFTLEGTTGSAHTVFGVSASWMSDQIFGIEGDVMYAPGFFERSGGPQLIVDSAVTTVSGGVIAAVPLSITRESLRPYLVGGLGMIHAQSNDLITVFPEDRTFAGLHVGGGAMGFVNTRTGYRFDLRHFRSLSRGEVLLTGSRSNKLSFWRLSIGVMIRVG